MKKVFCAAAALCLCLTGCSGTEEPTKSLVDPDAILEIHERGQIDSEAIDLYNQAIKKMIDSGSFTATGHVTSGADLNGEVSSVITEVQSKSVKNGEKWDFTITASSNYDTTGHTTYFHDGYYYVSYGEDAIKSEKNEYMDYGLESYLLSVNAETVTTASAIEVDGNTNVQLTLPYGAYDCEALLSWLGFTDVEKLTDLPISISMTIDSKGIPTGIYIHLDSRAEWGEGDTILQTLDIGLEISSVGATALTPPENLDSYIPRETVTVDWGDLPGENDIDPVTTTEGLQEGE